MAARGAQLVSETVQRGIEYLGIDWPLDELMDLYLSRRCPEE
jgi:hypothetical protein